MSDEQTAAECTDLLASMLTGENPVVTITRRHESEFHVLWFRSTIPRRVDGYGPTLRDAVVDAVEQVDTPRPRAGLENVS